MIIAYLLFWYKKAQSLVGNGSVTLGGNNLIKSNDEVDDPSAEFLVRHQNAGKSSEILCTELSCVLSWELLHRGVSGGQDRSRQLFLGERLPGAVREVEQERSRNDPFSDGSHDKRAQVVEAGKKKGRCSEDEYAADCCIDVN